MTNAAAEYVIKAKDQTKGAVESIKKGFEGLDKSARKLSMGFKALGIGAVAFKTWRIATQGAEAAIANLVATNADFAKSINETKAAYQNLWVAGDQAAAAQERLNAALGNPELLGATRRLADGMAAGYIGLKASIIEALAEAQKLDRWMGERLGVYEKSDGLRRDFEGLVASKMPAAREAQRAKDAARGPNKYMDLVRGASARDAQEFAADAQKAAEAARKLNEEFSDGLRAAMGDAYSEIGRGYEEEAQRHREYFIEPVIANFGRLPVASKQAFDEMSSYAADFSRSIEGNIKHSLLNMEGGFKGFAKSAIDSMRDVMAEVAALKIRLAVFGALDEKTGNLSGGLLSGAFNSLFSFGGARAAGGPVDGGKSYLVGERGPELFTPARSGVITPSAGKSLVIHHAPVINVNAAQLTQDQAARMVADSQRRMWDDLDRRYGIA